MSTDNTPPRLRLIATIACIVIVTLIGLDFVFKSYYSIMTDEARREKIAPLTARIDQTKAETTSFAGAKVPMDQAVAQLKGTRSELIDPKPSDDMGPMTGWAKLPKQPPLAAPPGGPVPAGAPGGDAGMMAPDGGPASIMMGPDGGRPDVTPLTDGGVVNGPGADGGALPLIKHTPAARDAGH